MTLSWPHLEPRAAESGLQARPDDHAREETQQPDDGMPCISIFEFWEEGTQLVRSVSAHLSELACHLESLELGV